MDEVLTSKYTKLYIYLNTRINKYLPGKIETTLSSFDLTLLIDLLAPKIKKKKVKLSFFHFQ